MIFDLDLFYIAPFYHRYVIAWLSLNFILETSWVALYSDVCQWGIGVTRPNLHFFQYIQAYKPFADPVPPNIKQYQLYTDQVPASIVIYWPNTIKYHL